MILQFIEVYNSVGIKIPVIRGIGVEVGLFFPRKKNLFIVVQVVGATLKFRLPPFIDGEENSLK